MKEECCEGEFCEGEFCEGGPMKESPGQSTSGRYASYWNAFLYRLWSVVSQLLEKSTLRSDIFLM